MTAPEVLVMAGGEGRRLGALTTHVPKPMLPVAGQPLLQHLLEQLREQGVRHVRIAVRHLSHVIQDHVGDGRWLGLDVEYVVEREPLGTAGAVGLLPPLTEPLLVLNADLVVQVPVAAMLAQHRRRAAAVTVGAVEHRVPVPFGVLDCRGGDVLGLREKPELAVTVLAGVYLLSPWVAAAVPPGVPLTMPELVGRVVPRGRVSAFALPGPWLDIGTPDTYARADDVAAAARGVPAPRVVAEGRAGTRAARTMEVAG